MFCCRVLVDREGDGSTRRDGGINERQWSLDNQLYGDNPRWSLVCSLFAINRRHVSPVVNASSHVDCLLRVLRCRRRPHRRRCSLSSNQNLTQTKPSVRHLATRGFYFCFLVRVYWKSLFTREKLVAEKLKWVTWPNS